MVYDDEDVDESNIGVYEDEDDRDLCQSEEEKRKTLLGPRKKIAMIITITMVSFVAGHKIKSS